MDQAKKAKETKTPVKPTLKQWKTNVGKLLQKVESYAIGEDIQVDQSYLCSSEFLQQFDQLVSSETIEEACNEMRALKLKKTDEHVKKLEQIEESLTEINQMPVETVEQLLAVVTQTLRLGVDSR